MRDSVTVSEAARLLGVSRSKVWTLVREGMLRARTNPLDRRERLIALDELERLRGERSESREVDKRRDMPETIGLIHDPTMQGEEFEEVMERLWRPT